MVQVLRYVELFKGHGMGGEEEAARWRSSSFLVRGALQEPDLLWLVLWVCVRRLHMFFFVR
jgi:hypothetical protein